MFTLQNITMKRNIKLALIILSIGIFFSCKNGSSEAKLNGTWELRHVKGIQVANADPNFPKGNGNILKFNAGKLEHYAEGKLLTTEEYTVKEEKKKINDTEAQYTLVFKNNNPEKHIALTDGKLILFDGEIAADGTESTYEKL